MRTVRDIMILLGSIALAVWLTSTGFFDAALRVTAGIWFLDSFVAGALFTSMFTVAPATAAIAALARSGEPFWELVLGGALGSMVADLFILTILKDTLTDHIVEAVRRSGNTRLKYFIRRGKTRLAGTLIGGLIIASPLPDELGLLCMGLARSPRSVTMLLTFVLNGAGIAAIALIARTL